MQTDKSVNKEELPVEEKVITGAEKRAALLAARKRIYSDKKEGNFHVRLDRRLRSIGRALCQDITVKEAYEGQEKKKR